MGRGRGCTDEAGCLVEPLGDAGAFAQVKQPGSRFDTNDRGCELFLPVGSIPAESVVEGVSRGFSGFHARTAPMVTRLSGDRARR